MLSKCYGKNNTRNLIIMFKTLLTVILKGTFARYYNYKFLMNTGKVKFFNESKGYGFVTDDESGSEYFVHVSGLIDEIKQDDSVTFTLKEGKKGLNAVEVRLA